MYAYIYGTLEEVDSQQVVIEANGIGYHIFVPGLILQKLPSKETRLSFIHICILEKTVRNCMVSWKKRKNLLKN